MPTKLQKYDKYKPSGLEWLGDIPDGWKVRRVKDIVLKMETGTSVNAGGLPASDNEFGVLKTSCVYTGDFDINENKTVLEEEVSRLTCPVKLNTLIVSRMNTPELIGSAGLVRIAPKNIYLPDRLWQISFSRTSSEFVNYVTNTVEYRFFIKTICVGTSQSMQSISQDFFKFYPIPLPPLQTQTAIAKYLDTHTANIDKEVDLLTQKASKYQQLKQTLISETVTKGLDKSAKFKPSGVEWIGEIPEGWEVRRLKDFISFSIAGEVIDVSYWGEGEELMYSAGKYPVKCNFENFPSRKRTKQNDILIARNGDGFIHTPEVGSIYTNVVQMARLSAKVNKYFILYIMDTIKFNINQTSNGDFIASLNKALWFNSDLPFPPIQIQHQIAKYLDEKTGKIDLIITTINTKITKLKEYRKVLINDVVTGRVRVEN